MRSLIVNADDCNLTPGVTHAILECHDHGIVSSTSWLINLPSNADEIAAVRDSRIGVGLHLNVSLGAPVLKDEDVPSLVTEEGLFRKRSDYEKQSPLAVDLVKEYAAQINLFELKFGRLPTHLDTHHQLHDQPIFMLALSQVAREKRLPIRRSALMQTADFNRIYPGMVTTQALYGDLDAKAFWTLEKLEEVLMSHLSGTAEVMCHPGILDANLQQVTSMTTAREKEYELFSSPGLKNIMEKHKIKLINFSQLSAL